MYRKTADTIRDVLALAATMRPTWPEVNHRIALSGHPTCDGQDASKRKLAQIEQQLAEARDERREAIQARDIARDEWAQADGDLGNTESPLFKAVEEKVAVAGELDDRIASLKDQQVTMLKALGQDPDSVREGGRQDDRAAADGGWASGHLLANEQLRQQLARASSTKGRVGPIEVGEVVSREALVADVTGTTDMRRAPYLGVVPQLRRRLRVLDLIPTGQMDQNSLPYTQESGSFDTAVETAEGTAKPEAAVTFTDATADAQTIAHWLKLRKQALADYPALQSIIDGRLRYGVLRRLEGQVLNGNGSGSNIRGILNTTGIGAVTFPGAGTPQADQLLKGITTVYLANGEATGVVLHPTDWQNTLITKASGSGEYMAGGPFELVPSQIWGTPLIPSAALTQGTALVGDFEIGSQLFIREGVTVLMSDSDQDDFINNRITLLAEMRAALAVFRPAVFATVALQ